MSLLGIFKLMDISIFQNKKYNGQFEILNRRVFHGLSARRGRIFDVNGKVLVDNIGVNTLVYNKNNNTSIKEKDLALKLASVLEISEKSYNELNLKQFYLLEHDNGKDLITTEEYDLFKKRKLTSDDIHALKMSRITEEMIDTLSETEKKASTIYYNLNKGYSYQNKIIKKDLSDLEVALISEMDLPGVIVTLTWERTYPYGDTLRSIFGSISNNFIPKELKSYYLDKGLSLDSTVGMSNLELEYDDYLRGKDALYNVDQFGKVTKIEEEKPGSDLYLSIDIDTQLKVEEILKREMLLAKKARNTEYYNHSYVMVGHPLTGEIVAMSGLQLIDDHFWDITSTAISSSYTVGSIVKGASMSVGYKQGLIEKGKKVTDSCIKVYGVQEKCSWTRLGLIDDIRAMAQSSNYFQFLTAVKMTNPNYKWNSKLNANIDHFNIYRDVFKSYGLGTLTGIDLPNERTGIIGKTVSDDLLLNLTIGQYDTYTPIEVFQYINTLANNGIRLKPSLMKKIVTEDGQTIENEVSILNNAILNEEDMTRVQMGLREVMISGTGRNYTNKTVSSAGKTGTSETFVDTDNDGKMDTKTISSSFIMYAPFENPEYSIIIMSPNISRSNGTSSYKYSLNLRVNKQIYAYLFNK